MTGFEAILNLFLHFFTIINKLIIATLVPLRDSTHPYPFPRKGRKSFLTNEGGLKVGAVFYYPVFLRHQSLTPLIEIFLVIFNKTQHRAGKIFFYKKNLPSAQDVSP